MRTSKDGQVLDRNTVLGWWNALAPSLINHPDIPTDMLGLVMSCLLYGRNPRLVTDKHGVKVLTIGSAIAGLPHIEETK